MKMLTAFFCGDGEPCVDWEEEMTEIIVVTAWRGNHFSKYGDIYFINGSGNHRVCQAKFLGIETVQCEVTEFVIEKAVLPGVTPVLHKSSI